MKHVQPVSPSCLSPSLDAPTRSYTPHFTNAEASLFEIFRTTNTSSGEAHFSASRACVVASLFQWQNPSYVVRFWWVLRFAGGRRFFPATYVCTCRWVEMRRQEHKGGGERASLLVIYGLLDGMGKWDSGLLA